MVSTINRLPATASPAVFYHVSSAHVRSGPVDFGHQEPTFLYLPNEPPYSNLLAKATIRETFRLRSEPHITKGKAIDH